MKNKRTNKRQTRKLVIAVLSGALLISATGCIEINIKTAEPQKYGQVPEPPVGGNFVPVQAAPLGAGPATVCGNPVSKTYVRFSNPYLTQTPPAGATGFRGTVVDLTTGQTIANTDYYLQYFVNSVNNGCCAPVTGSTTDVRCNVTAGLPYRFTAFFKTGLVPPSGDQIQLQGAWTP